MIDPITADWDADGATLYFSPDRAYDFVGLHNATLARHIAERHNEALAALRRALEAAQADLDTLQAASGAAARTLLLKEQKIAELESQLGQAYEQLGYLGRLVEILRDAAAPAATTLFNITQLPLDDHTRETIQQTLAPLEAALAATRGRET
jgi:hypothetical protein